MLDKDSIGQATMAYVPPTAIYSQLESEDVFNSQNLQPEELLNITLHPVLGNIVACLSGRVGRKYIEKFILEC